MRRPLAVLPFLLAWAAAGERAFVETEAPATRYVHQPFTVRLRVGLDVAHAVQIFPRRFDLPVQVDAPWLDGLDGAVLRPPRAGDTTLVLNGEPATAVRIADRDGLTVVEIERTFVPTEAGALGLAAPRLRHATATRFREDFIQGRVPLDRRDETVEGEPLAVRVAPLPAAGRPPGFTGAVGRFTVSATAAPRALDAGSVAKLALRIEGEGNLALFDTPRLDGLDGFHVYGMIDDRATPRRTITYDVAPLTGDVAGVPAIPFVFFDPDATAYRSVETEPIPLSVRGRVAPGAPVEPERGLPVLPVALAVAALALAAVVWRRSRARPDEPVPDAAALFRARAREDLAGAFTEYLAARLDCPTASVIAPDLAARLRVAGAPADLADQVAAHVERLVAARYGGAAPDDAADETHRLVDSLER